MASSELAELRQILADHDHRIGVAEDTKAVRELCHSYGYYLDKCHYKEVVDLFAEDGAVRFHGGVYKGKAGIKRLYIDRFQKRFVAGRNGPVKGFLLDHLIMQDIVHISDDRLSASCRYRGLMQAGRHRDCPVDPKTAPTVPRQWWEGGIHEDRFGRKSVNDPWRITLINYRAIYHGDFGEGWSNAPPNYVPLMAVCYPEDPVGPDELVHEDERWLWPDAHTFPFHYKHPVTGEDRPSAGDQIAPDIRDYMKSLQNSG